MALYPRVTKDGALVADDQMVSPREHLYVKHRIIVIFGEITGETQSTDLMLALDSISHEPIKILITSPGGLLAGAFFLYDAFRLVKSPVYTVGRFCCSAATLLLAGGDKRYVFPHARVMLHLPSGMLVGDTRDIEIQQEEIRRGQDSIITLLQEHGVKRTKNQILKDIDRDYWMSPSEAIAYGLADEVVTEDTMQGWLS